MRLPYRGIRESTFFLLRHRCRKAHMHRGLYKAGNGHWTSQRYKKSRKDCHCSPLCSLLDVPWKRYEPNGHHTWMGHDISLQGNCERKENMRVCFKLKLAFVNLQSLSTDAIRTCSSIWMPRLCAVLKGHAHGLGWLECPPLAVLIFSAKLVAGICITYLLEVDRVFL